MKPAISHFLLAATLGTTQCARTDAPAHVSNSFSFDLAIPIAKAAPFFGPEGERCWAGAHWNPQFAWPQPARDTQGMVFTVAHAGHKSTWVNTVFDLAGGRMQYVAVIPSHMASVIDVRLTAASASQISVQVTYTRTALDSAANEAVREAGDRDRNSGSEWKQSIEQCLARP